MLTKTEKLNEGQTAYNEGDYDKAYKLLIPLAEQGCAVAQCAIATMYHCALGIEVNGVEALRWYLEAAKQGDPVACNNLATIYWTGLPNLPADPQEAEKWRLKAIENGFDM